MFCGIWWFRPALPVFHVREHDLLAGVHADIVLVSDPPQVLAYGRAMDGAGEDVRGRDRLAGRARGLVRRLVIGSVLRDVVCTHPGTFL